MEPLVPPRGSRITQCRAIVSRIDAGVVVLIDTSRGRRLALSTLEGRVWALLAQQPTLPDVMERLRDDATRTEQLAEDVTRLLARWRELGVIAWR